MSSARGQRIEANCKIIWGDDCAYDLSTETDDFVNYICFVKKDFGLSFGPPLAMTSVCPSETEAWEELDRMLRLWAQQVQSGKPMTKAERLNIFGGRRGQHSMLLSSVLDAFEKREGTKAE